MRVDAMDTPPPTIALKTNHDNIAMALNEWHPEVTDKFPRMSDLQT